MSLVLRELGDLEVSHAILEHLCELLVVVPNMNQVRSHLHLHATSELVPIISQLGCRCLRSH